MCCCFFCFKQKTAYDMRISDWSSDVCSSDLRGGRSGKTSLAYWPATADGILAPSSGRWANSGMGSPTAFSTLSTSEFPNGAVASSLSDILETGDLPQRYFLSAKACSGILRRAEKRGKTLPLALSRALRQTGDGASAQTKPQPDTSSPMAETTPADLLT